MSSHQRYPGFRPPFAAEALHDLHGGRLQRFPYSATFHYTVFHPAIIRKFGNSYPNQHIDVFLCKHASFGALLHTQDTRGRRRLQLDP